MNKITEKENHDGQVVKIQKWILKWISKLKSITPISSDGYYDLYSTLMYLITSEGNWNYWRSALFLLLLLVIYYSFIAINKFWGAWGRMFIALLLFLLTYFCIAIISVFIRIIVPNLRYSSKKFIPELAAMLLLCIPRPYTQQSGLLYADIVRLKRIAEVERNSVEWRNSFVNFIIVGSMTVLIWITVWIIRINWSDISSTLRNVSPPNQTLINSEPSVILLVLFICFIGVIILSTLFRLFDYFAEYFSSEYPNRLIILSCEEALAFCEKFEITAASELPFEQRRATALHFGMRLISYDSVPKKDRSVRLAFLDEGGKLWMLGTSTTRAKSKNILSLINTFKNKHYKEVTTHTFSLKPEKTSGADEDSGKDKMV